MHRFFFSSAAVLSTTLVFAAGCGSTVTNPTGGGGDSGSAGTGAVAGNTGTGGTGGVACTPSDELCDGQDNDCDGETDEGCACIQGEVEACYSGDAATKDVGACKSGTRTCDVNGVFGACTGEVLPSAEACNLVDDDCNGSTDDMGMAMCGVGACMASVLKCDNGTPNTCVPGSPTPELCDGLDNNCNQLVDETFPNAGMACDSGLLGECKTGVTQCLTVNGVTSQKCVANKMPGMEACDGLDNDCNGTTDDNVPGTGSACSTGQLGPCNAGTISCKNNSVDCYPNTAASAEVCDGIDNDCNGVNDDPPGVNMPCDTGLLGACKDGIQKCSGGAFGCVQSVQAQATDVCGDNIDNDCNGSVDPGCLYSFSGVVTNLPIAQLTGWTQCYQDFYSNTGTSLTTILQACNKSKLLLACRVTNSTTLQVAANGPRLDVIFDTGGASTPHDANGVGWYYNGNFAAWGFAVQGDPISLGSCDTIASSFNPGGPNPDKRLCWHTASNTIDGGWRCGANDSLNGSGAYQRLVFHAD